MENYSLILISLPIAILLALVIMILIRCLAGCFIYVLIFVAIAALIAFGTFILIGNPLQTGYGAISLVEDPKWKIIVGGVCYLLALIIFVVFCCFKSKLALASKIVEVAAVFVAGNCGIVLVPFILFIVTILFVTLWIF
jgi:solute carrier family 44 (choline transporter-like protein), member 1